MKIGILGTAYNCVDGLLERLRPFQRPDFIISIVSSQFKEYADLGYPEENEGTRQLLQDLYETKQIQYLSLSTAPQTEIEARNSALIPLLQEGCDYILQVDFLDENYKDKDLDNIIKYLEENKDIAWFSINFKNYVFSPSTWIDGFCPARIHKVSFYNGQTLKVSGFYEDNNIFYTNHEGDKILDKRLSSKIVPKRLVQISHYSWLNNESSKRKILYQQKRGWSCSYKWDEKLGLQFNEEYFRANNLTLPEVIEE